MANRYWVGGTADWDATAGTKWSLTSGGAGGQAVPTNVDDVFFDANSGANTVTIGTGYTAVPKSIVCTGFTGTLAGTGNLTVVGTITFVAGMTITCTGTLSVNAASTMTSGTKTWTGALKITSNVTYTLADDWTVNGTVTYGGSNSNFHLNGFTLYCNGGLGGEDANNFNIGSGTTVIVLSGTGNFGGNQVNINNNLVINTAGTITLTDAGGGTYGIAFRGTHNFTYTAGTIIKGTCRIAILSTTVDISGISGGIYEFFVGSGATATLSTDVTCVNFKAQNPTSNTTLNGSKVHCTNCINTNETTVLQGTTDIVVDGGDGTISGTFTTGRIANDFEIASSGTVTLSGTLNFGGGNFKYTSGTLTGTPTIGFRTSSSTWTNNATMTLTGAIVTSSVALTFDGTHGFSVGSFTCTTAGLTFTWQALRTYVFNGNLTLTGTAASKITFASSSGTDRAIITLANNGSIPDVGFVNATRIDSSQGQTIWDWDGTLTDTLNWNPLTTPKTVGYASVV